jgi:hypothetical protein
VDEPYVLWHDLYRKVDRADAVSARDFDFLHGSWRIAHRYLTERLAGCDEWITFESMMRCWPVLGGTANMDEGYGPDTHNGAPVVCRYTWSDITPTSLRWAQALSPDDEVTWETNWIMELTRMEEEP